MGRSAAWALRMTVSIAACEGSLTVHEFTSHSAAASGLSVNVKPCDVSSPSMYSESLELCAHPNVRIHRV